MSVPIMMNIASALTALCDMLHARTGVDVVLGRPDDTASGIYVWPWRLSEDALPRNLPKSRGEAASSTHPVADLMVDFLVVVRPALTVDGLSRLVEAREAMIDNPILSVDGTRVRIILHPLTADQLAAVFSAAAIPLTVCVSATLKGSG